MFVDIAAALIVLAAAIQGGAKGWFHTLARLLVVAFALTLTWLVGPELALFYQGKTGATAETSMAVGFTISFVTFWGVIAYGASRAVRSLHDPELRPTALDRLGGACLGLVKGAAIAYLAVAIGVTWYMGAGTPDLGYAQSHATGWVLDHNIVLDKVAGLEVAAEDKEDEAEEKARERPEWQYETPKK